MKKIIREYDNINFFEKIKKGSLWEDTFILFSKHMAMALFFSSTYCQLILKSFLPLASGVPMFSCLNFPSLGFFIYKRE